MQHSQLHLTNAQPPSYTPVTRPIHLCHEAEADTPLEVICIYLGNEPNRFPRGSTNSCGISTRIQTRTINRCIIQPSKGWTTDNMLDTSQCKIVMATVSLLIQRQRDDTDLIQRRLPCRVSLSSSELTGTSCDVLDVQVVSVRPGESLACLIALRA